MIEITLTWAELWQASLAGCQRRIVSMRDGRNKNLHAEKSDWATDIDGAAAEVAFAKWAGAYWNAGVNTFKEPDIGDTIQIRSTNHRSGCLIVRGNDDGAHVFVLALTADLPLVRLAGWALGEEVAREEYWRGDAWWVPQDRLRPMWEQKEGVAPNNTKEPPPTEETDIIVKS